MSNLVLYRKYRPKTFASVANQEPIKQTLANAVTNNRVAHAYLFVGPRGVGKTTLARIFARAINCPHRTGAEPCNDCEVCRSFLDATSLDLMEIDAASHTGVDNIRELIDHLQFAPTRAAYKVIIIDEVHMLSKGAFNALLKTLEEPPKHAVFILATTEAHKIPATIISRTQRFDFKKVSLADLAALLQSICADNGVIVEPAALQEIAAAADGSFRDGLSLLDQVMNYAGGTITEELVEEVLGLTSVKTTAAFADLLIAGDAKPAVEFIGQLVYAGRDLSQFQKDFLEYLRKLLIVKVQAARELGLGADATQKIQAQAEQLPLDRIARLIRIFQKSEADMKWTAIQSLPLELAAVEATGESTPEAPAPKSPQAEAEAVGEAAPIESKANEAASANPELFELVSSRWPQILDRVKEYNHSLLSSLKLAEIKEVAGKDLVLVFPYKFHKDAIDARKNRIVIDQVVEEICGVKLLVKPLLAREWNGPGAAATSAPEDKPGALESALKIMGGEIQG